MKKNIINDVVIVVPVYKEYMTLGEQISFQQLVKILGRYNICLIIPDRLQMRYKSNNVFCVESFDNNYFQGLTSYSHLLMDNKLYERFRTYKYMLIYQLDAFVFSDRLEEFISMGYDYIGAVEPKYLSTWKTINNYVGNGGLSLRKISSARRMIEKKKEICKGHSLENTFQEAEDLFFSYCATIPQLKFSVPKKEIAMKFSVDYDVSHCYRRLGQQLPFGCHGWNKRNFVVWKPIIERFGYNLIDFNEADEQNNSYYLRWEYVKKYLIYRSIRIKNRKNIKGILSSDKYYSIWGYGRVGKEALKNLIAFGVNISMVYDRRLEKDGKAEGGVQVVEPTKEEICKRKSIIIITTTEYERDIKNVLERYGLCKDRDYLLYRELIEAFIKRRYFYDGRLSFCCDMKR